MLCCYRMVFTSCHRCISILAVSLICSLSGPLSHGSPVVVFTAARGLLEFQFHCLTNDKIQSHEPSVRSQRAKVARNGKSRGQGESFSRKRADICTYCQYRQYLIAKCKQSHLKVFFTICAFYKLILFF